MNATRDAEVAVCLECPMDDCDESDERCPLNAVVPLDRSVADPHPRPGIVPPAGRGRRRIDWDGIRLEYGRETGEHFETLREMLSSMYRSRTLRQIGKRLGVAEETIRRQFRRNRIAIRNPNVIPPEGDRPKSARRRKFDAIPAEALKTMTMQEIQVETGYKARAILRHCARRGVFYAGYYRRSRATVEARRKRKGES